MRRKAALALEEQQSRAQRRVHQMSNVDLYDWSDAAGNGLYKALQDYRAHGHAESLEEIGYALVGLQAVHDELVARHKE